MTEGNRAVCPQGRKINRNDARMSQFSWRIIKEIALPHLMGASLPVIYSI